tara:strand:- start:151 stop:327 length:177 start_codon:yes stop_codon:yes gene_type:complete
MATSAVAELVCVPLDRHAIEVYNSQLIPEAAAHACNNATLVDIDKGIQLFLLAVISGV